MRIIAISGGKGGIFKTGTAQSLGAWLDKHGVKWRGADTDQENKSFHDVYGERVTPFDVYDVEVGELRRENVNKLVNDMDRARQDGYEVYLLDQGAGQGNVLRGAFTETGLIGEVISGELKLTIVFVTVNTDAALSALATNLQNTFVDVPTVSWIIGANEYKDTLETRVADGLNDPTIAALLKQRNATTIRIPQITDEDVVASWENSHMPLSEFAKKGNYAERGRISKWINDVFVQFDSVTPLLRDEAKPTKARPTAEATK